MRLVVASGPLAVVALICGWITTEVGRQPWTIYGVLRTADSVSPVAAEAVATSLVAFVVVYFALFGAGTFYILRLMGTPPHPSEPGLSPHEPMRAQGIMPGPVLASPLPHAAGEVGRRPGEGQ